MDDKTIRSMKRYLDNVYNDLECEVTPLYVIWYKNGKPVAKVMKYNNRLNLSSPEFYSFIKTFSLNWDDETDKKIIRLITPYLKYNGGSPAIPVLIDMGFIEEIVQIGLPSYLN